MVEANKQVKKIGVVTGGGDCPGLNAVIRAVVLGCLNRGWVVYGIERGIEGMLIPERVHTLSRQDVRGIIHTGGTILGTTNRGKLLLPLAESAESGPEDAIDQLAAAFFRLNLDALIVIGGDGTLKIARDLGQRGVPLVGVPKTIDNDLMATEMTFGFSTAVTTATDAIDKLHATAESHERVMIVEVMGRYAGWIALYSGMSGGGDVILLPEIPYRIDSIVKKLHERWKRRRNFAIVVAAEGARPIGGEMIFKAREAGREPRLGGIAERLAADLYHASGYETRSLVLGHLQRGGQPTPHDRLLATRFGAAAVRAIENGEQNVMVAYQSSSIVTVPLERAISERKCVPIDYDVIISGRELGISFGDE